MTYYQALSIKKHNFINIILNFYAKKFMLII